MVVRFTVWQKIEIDDQHMARVGVMDRHVSEIIDREEYLEKSIKLSFKLHNLTPS